MYLHIYAGHAATNNYFKHNFTQIIISCIKFAERYESSVGTLKYFGEFKLPKPFLYTCLDHPNINAIGIPNIVSANVVLFLIIKALAIIGFCQ